MEKPKARKRERQTQKNTTAWARDGSSSKALDRNVYKAKAVRAAVPNVNSARFPLRALNLSRVSCDMSGHRTDGGKDAPFPFLGSFFILGIPG